LNFKFYKNEIFQFIRKVYKGKCLETGKLVALKKFRIETEREGVIKQIYVRDY